MIIAALLFIAGLTLGWRFNALAVVISSILVFVCSEVLFIMLIGFEYLQILIVFAYLIAHQSGYLVGYYLFHRLNHDMAGKTIHQNHMKRPDRL